MSKQPAAPPAPTNAPISTIRFEDCDYTTAETQRILGVRKTTLFDKLLRNGELESYLAGTSRKITGRSIREYRERKLAEARARPTEHLRKAKTENENGASDFSGTP